MLWLGALAIATALLVPFRTRLDQSHIALVLLLVVLAAASDGGRRVGLTTAGLAFVSFNWYFLPPFGTLVIADPLDWFVLAAFLGTSVVASQLFHRVQREADRATARAQEVGALASLGAEAMGATRADAALQVVAEQSRRALGVSMCSIHVVRMEPGPGGGKHFDSVHAAGAPANGDDEMDQVRIVADRSTGLATLDGGIVRFFPATGDTLLHTLGNAPAHRLLFPLRVGDTVIGVFDVEAPGGIPLNESRQRLLAALTYYAALGSERWRLEQTTDRLEAMREADRLKNAVLASVSHDLRTPLTTIKALAHGLGELGDERSEIIEQEADRLNRFVTDMLDVSRLTSGHLALQLAVVPVEELVAAALQQVEGAFGRRLIDVRLGADNPLLLARFDLTHSVRILVNLLENARKYAPDHSPIELTAQRAGAWVLLSVADRGPGVPTHEEERIFDALYRPANARPDQGSAGLGLAIARGLAEAQGGTLVHTARDGGGSLFTLSLPVAELADVLEPSTQEAIASRSDSSRPHPASPP